MWKWKRFFIRIARFASCRIEHRMSCNSICTQRWCILHPTQLSKHSFSSKCNDNNANVQEGRHQRVRWSHCQHRLDRLWTHSLHNTYITLLEICSNSTMIWFTSCTTQWFAKQCNPKSSSCCTCWQSNKKMYHCESQKSKHIVAYKESKVDAGMANA